MASFEAHCEESVQLFGDRFEHVHLWLDEFAGTPAYRSRHRRARHHEAGLREVERLFGPAAVPVARRHIITDLEGEGWQQDRDVFPADEMHYKRLGYW
ncbi:MAG: hypothetical protein IT378_04565 [Sandaracinaceae bacterium]|nr:hypothetical protein [Sandaracinaceae bacterium]